MWHHSSCAVQPLGYADRESIKKPILLFRILSNWFLNTFTELASTASCDKLFHLLMTRTEKKKRRNSKIYVLYKIQWNKIQQNYNKKNKNKNKIKYVRFLTHIEDFMSTLQCTFARVEWWSHSVSVLSSKIQPSRRSDGSIRDQSSMTDDFPICISMWCHCFSAVNAVVINRLVSRYYTWC